MKLCDVKKCSRAKINKFGNGKILLDSTSTTDVKVRT